MLYPDSKFYRANMGPIWGWQDPGGPYVGPMNFDIWDSFSFKPQTRHFWEIKPINLFLYALFVIYHVYKWYAKHR